MEDATELVIVNSDRSLFSSSLADEQKYPVETPEGALNSYKCLKQQL